jgi:hypothetical protein
MFHLLCRSGAMHIRFLSDSSVRRGLGGSSEARMFSNATDVGKHIAPNTIYIYISICGNHSIQHTTNHIILYPKSNVFATTIDVLEVGGGSEGFGGVRRGSGGGSEGFRGDSEGFGGVGRGSEGSGRFGARHRGSEGFARGLRLEIYVHKSSPKVHEKFTMVNFQKTHKYNVFCTLKAHRPESSPKVHQRFSKMSRVLEAQNLRQGLAWGKIARAPQNLSLGWPKTLLGLPARSSQLEVPSFSSQLEVQRPQVQMTK